MKVFKMMFILFSLSMLNQSQAEDFIKINQYIDELSTDIKLDLNKPYRIYQINNKLNDIKKITTQCVSQENQIINQYENETRNLLDINQFEYGIAERNKLLKNLRNHQDAQKFCQYINVKIDAYNQKIAVLKRLVYKKSLFTKNQSIIETLKHLSQSFFSRLPTGFLQKQFIEKANTVLSAKAEIFSVMIFIFLKILGYIKFQNLKFLQELSTARYFMAVFIYAIFAPVQYITLKGIFFQFGELSLQIFQIKLVAVMILVFIYYTYQHYKPTSLFRDFLSLFFYGALLVGLIHYCLEVLNLKLTNGADIDMLGKKYIIITLMQPMIFIIADWMFIKILHLKKAYHKYLYCFYLFCALNFILGTTLWINIAINIDFLIMINCVFFAWLLIIHNTKNYLIESFNDSSNALNKALEKFFLERKKIAVFHIKAIIYLFYIASVSLLSFALIGINFWLFLERMIVSMIDGIFHNYQYDNLSLSFVNLVQAVYLIVFLNICNYAFSNYYAYQFFKDRVARQNASMFFTWIGYAISCLIILKFLGFELQNIFLLLGGLSLGVGLGLKNILSGFISGFILLLNRPFKYGDFIEIGDTKGYVKKVSLMETTIETPDNNILILPNQYVTSSVIQNYTYEDKDFQKVHIQYVINNLDVSLEDDIKMMISQLLHKNDYLFEDEHHPITQLFSLHVEPLDTYRLEIIFCLNNQIDIKKELSKINRRIYEKLKDMKLDVHFEDMLYPFK